jgi:hypothetical protein
VCRWRRRKIRLTSTFWAYTQKNSTIASRATPTGSAGRAPDEDEIINFAIKKGNYGVHIGENYQLHCQWINIRPWYSLIHSHREGFTTSQKEQPKDFGYWNSQTRLTTKLWFSSRIITIKSLNTMTVKDREGKNLGSVQHGQVYVHECALLVNFCIHDTKKNPGGRTGYPEKYWNHVFVSPKCGKRLGYARYGIQV